MLNKYGWVCNLCGRDILTEKDGVFDAVNDYSAHKECLFKLLLGFARNTVFDAKLNQLKGGK